MPASTQTAADRLDTYHMTFKALQPRFVRNQFYQFFRDKSAFHYAYETANYSGHASMTVKSVTVIIRA